MLTFYPGTTSVGPRFLLRTANKIHSVADARALAERRLPSILAQYLRAGTGSRRTAVANPAAFDRITFRPRVGVRADKQRNLSTTVLGQEISMPVMIAPTGGGRLVHPDGERGGARAAGAAGTIQWVSTFAGTSIEEIAADASGPLFFQLYYPGSRDAARALVERARAVGCKALVLTVDSGAVQKLELPLKGRVMLYPTGRGRRPPVEWARIAASGLRKPRWTTGFLRDRGAGLYAAMIADGEQRVPIVKAPPVLLRETPIWEDIPWLKEIWKGPVIVKGILRPEDARLAVDHGADAIVVSNHGGNMLDGDPPAITMLPDVVAAVGDEVEVLFDSGIRRGSDVVKALAMGARAVLVGRAWLWALAAAGEEGVAAMLESLREQVDATLGGLGCQSVQDLDASFIEWPPEWQRE